MFGEEFYPTPGSIARKMLAKMNATEFNDRAWSSKEMAGARHHIREALAELSDESKGWGLMPLEAARTHLAKAVELITTMEAWK